MKPYILFLLIINSSGFEFVPQQEFNSLAICNKVKSLRTNRTQKKYVCAENPKW